MAHYRSAVHDDPNCDRPHTSRSLHRNAQGPSPKILNQTIDILNHLDEKNPLGGDKVCTADRGQGADRWGLGQ